MSEGIMGAGLFEAPDLPRARERDDVRPEVSRPRPAEEWSPENFAREQIRGLVRQVFFSNAKRPVRHVVFSAVESETEVRSICRGVGEALARETLGSIALVGGYPQVLQNAQTDADQMAESAAQDGGVPLRQIATRLRSNLWLLPATGIHGDPITTAALPSRLWEMRREFEYSIVEGPPAGESSAATAMAQLADGIILVLSAHNTRRSAARKIKEMLEGAQARILGTVLSDRVFPIPQAIYRRL